jgi:phosphoribosylformylglycinamidine cyclo-ligase
MKQLTYKRAGVDLGEYENLVPFIKGQLKKASVSSGGGLFAGLLDLRRQAEPDSLLVASVDGVGTKVKVATESGRHTGIGRDIVAHCVNDIVCLGARPVAFMDYIGFGKLDTVVFKQVFRGLVAECKKHKIQLIGGETAEMPVVYRKGEYDVVGFILGVASKRNAVDGSGIRKGDLIVGLPSNGLHTNGYSLARKVLLRSKRLDLKKRPPGWRQSLGRALLKPHTNYFDQVYPLVERRLVSGIAHVTGGGIPGNLERILPGDCGARLRKRLWPVPRIFDLIAQTGPVDEEEMFRVFNMGLGMLVVTPHKHLPEVLRHARASRVVGEIVRGGGEVVIE